MLFRSDLSGQSNVSAFQYAVQVGHNFSSKFKTPLLVINRSSRQKVNNGIVELNRTISQWDLIVICRVFHPTTEEYTFFSSSVEHSPRWTTFMGHKTDLNKTYKNINYISMLSEHSRIRLKKSIAERYL